MARANWRKVSSRIVAHEGGYSDDPRDDGNWTGGKRGKGKLKGTKFGIAANTYGHLDIKNLTREEAIAIFKKDFWDVANLDRVPAGIDYCVVDFNINSGVDRAVRELQKILGVKQDGTMGSATIDALDNFPRPMEELIDLYMNARWAYMQKLRTFKTYQNGWRTRVADVRRAAKAMCAGKTIKEKVTAVNVNRNDKARDEDTKVSSALVGDATNTATTGTGLAAAGATVSEFAEKIEPISYYADWAQTAFIALLAVGFVITIILMIKKKREGK
jgi:lysozyme family protein